MIGTTSKDKKQLLRFGSSSTYLWLSESSSSEYEADEPIFVDHSTGTEVLERNDPELGENRQSPHSDDENNSQDKQQSAPWPRRKKCLCISLLITTAIALVSVIVLFSANIIDASRAQSPNNQDESQSYIFENDNEKGSITSPLNANKTQESHADDSIANTPNPSETTPEVVYEPTIIPTIAAESNDVGNDVDRSNDRVDEHGSLPQHATDSPTTIREPKEIVVLHPNESLTMGQFRYSPNRRFKIGLPENNGNLVLIEVDPSGKETELWSTGESFGRSTVCFLQTDGNLVLRDSETRTSLWMTKTHDNAQATLMLNDSGQIAMRSDNVSRTILWMQGTPRYRYTGPTSEDMAFPVRGAFYYPWYPSTWHVNGHRAHYETSLGLYSSSDPTVAAAHIEAMDFGKIQLSIASWWGPNTNLDRSRLTMLMEETIAQNSPLKWTVYHEDERDYDPSPGELRNDFDYLKKWFAWHEAWAHVEGKPVIFVYNEGGCDIANRWMEASRGEWYVVLKLFSGFEDCPLQPDSWHQYGVGEKDGTVHNPGYSYVVSPGFWKADTDIPYLKRLDRTQFCYNTQKMVESSEPWQLIVSFNEAGEGTLIEPSPDWESDSGFGDYLDCLHEYSQ